MARKPGFVIDTKLANEKVTAHAGVTLVPRMLRASGASDVLDSRIKKQRERGLSSSQMVESLFVLWSVGGERISDLEHIASDEALASLLGHSIPAPQTMRDFLDTFEEESLPLFELGPKASIPQESSRVSHLGAANRALTSWVQTHAKQTTATLDIDATIVESDKRAAQRTYKDGIRGYQPVVVVWAEQDLVVYDEFRDGNVPAGAGNKRVVERALEQLPADISKICVRGDSALYEHDLLWMLDEKKIEYAISADMSTELRHAILALDESAWQLDEKQSDAVREYAEVSFTPKAMYQEGRKSYPRYIAIRVRKNQGSLFADGSDRRHYAVVSNRSGAPLDVLTWHRAKAGTVEHVHDDLKNGLAAQALPSKRFHVNAAWFRLNCILYNVLSALKRIALDGDFADAKPKRLRFQIFTAVGHVIQHARETLLRLSDHVKRAVIDYGINRIDVHWRTLAGD